MSSSLRPKAHARTTTGMRIIELEFYDLSENLECFVVELEQPNLQWKSLPEALQTYCAQNIAIIEVWVTWTDETPSWKVFTEVVVIEDGVTRTLRAVRTQSDVIIRVLCQAFDEMFKGRPVEHEPADSASGVSSPPIHSLYLSARRALLAATQRQLELISQSNPASPGIFDNGHPEFAASCSAVLERIWRRDHPPRTSLRSFCVSDPKFQIDEIPRGIISASVERAFVAKRYLTFSGRLSELLTPFRHTPIVGALEHFVQGALNEAEISVSDSSRVRPSMDSLESAHSVLVRLLHELSEIGAPEHAGKGDEHHLIVC